MVTISARTDIIIKEKLKSLAAERGISVSAYLRNLIFEAYREYLKRKGLRK